MADAVGGGAHRPTVLVAERLGAPLLARLVADRPEVAFVSLPSSGEVPEAGRGATALLRVALDRAALATALSQAPELRWIHTSTAGFDWLLIPEVIDAVERGRLQLTRSAASYSVAIGEFVVGAIALLLKRFPEFAEAQRQQRWVTVEPAEFADATLAVVGAGAIGREVARRARALGMRTLGLKRSPEPLPEFDRIEPPERLHELVGAADIVVLAAPLTPETERMIDRAALAAMRPSAHLINVGRGGLIDTPALIDALRSGTLAGALLDVFDQEPLPADSPLWGVPNLVITPHTSFRSPRSLERVVEEFDANLGRFLAGEPLAHALRDLRLGY